MVSLCLPLAEHVHEPFLHNPLLHDRVDKTIIGGTFRVECPSDLRPSAGHLPWHAQEYSTSTNTVSQTWGTYMAWIASTSK